MTKVRFLFVFIMAALLGCVCVTAQQPPPPAEGILPGEALIEPAAPDPCENFVVAHLGREFTVPAGGVAVLFTVDGGRYQVAASGPVNIYEDPCPFFIAGSDEHPLFVGDHGKMKVEETGTLWVAGTDLAETTVTVE